MKTAASVSQRYRRRGSKCSRAPASSTTSRGRRPRCPERSSSFGTGKRSPHSTSVLSPDVKRSLSRIALLLLLTPTGLAADADDWPQFRGPTGQGHSAERGVPVDWSESRHIV